MENRNFVIIGGNTGIGKLVVENLKAAGANVFTYSRSGTGSGKLDVTNDFQDIPDLPEVIDGLVYCPGTINLKPFHRFSIKDFKTDY